jgi:hypothetical protein
VKNLAFCGELFDGRFWVDCKYRLLCGLEEDSSQAEWLKPAVDGGGNVVWKSGIFSTLSKMFRVEHFWYSEFNLASIGRSERKLFHVEQFGLGLA